ncbi:hypothetical protein [Piscinibacter gummiphilus]|uniref:Uncharacterized protein n=1 Tax=Piscinibacter gummiphilus TaxID=946333 RepID=A0ABZ0CNJ0_9BURK|nr:hypothetical protein [Piscinibacter gummiphilus]WOB06562.1 hypothetical protein RXV79_16710 [Piscinibacter gummiphilus]
MTPLKTRGPYQRAIFLGRQLIATPIDMRDALPEYSFRRYGRTIRIKAGASRQTLKIKFGRTP